MREITKSTISAFLEVGRTGARLTLQLVVPERELTATLDATFRAVDTLQRGVVDLTWGVFGANG